MRTEPLLALALTACATLSTRDDLVRVRELARLPVATDLGARNVDAETDAQAVELLQHPLSIDDAVRAALIANRELRATYREIGITRGRLVQAGLVANPVVEVEYLPERQTQLALRVEYDLTSLVLAPVHAGAVRPELDADRFRAAAATIDTGYRVRMAYYTLAASTQQLAIATHVLDAQAAARDAMAALVASGNLRTVDLAGQDAAYQDGRVVLADVSLRVQDDRERMNRLLGVHGTETAWQLGDALAEPPAEVTVPDTLERDALTASLDLRARHARLEATARRAGFARTAGVIPDVAVDLHVLQGSVETVGIAPQNAPWQLGAGVRVTLPVFDHQQGNVAMYAAEFDAGLERYHGAAITLRSRARTARARLVAAHARARLYRVSIVPARTHVLEQMLLQYNAMQVSVFQLLAARREQLEAQMSAVAAVRDYWIARAAMDALLAGHDVDEPTDAAMEGH